MNEDSFAQILANDSITPVPVFLTDENKITALHNTSLDTFSGVNEYKYCNRLANILGRE